MPGLNGFVTICLRNMYIHCLTDPAAACVAEHVWRSYIALLLPGRFVDKNAHADATTMQGLSWLIAAHTPLLICWLCRPGQYSSPEAAAYRTWDNSTPQQNEDWARFLRRSERRDQKLMAAEAAGLRAYSAAGRWQVSHGHRVSTHATPHAICLMTVCHRYVHLHS